MTEQQIFDRIVTIIQERQGEDFVVTENLSLKDDLDADSVDLMEFVLTIEDEFGIKSMMKKLTTSKVSQSISNH